MAIPSGATPIMANAGGAVSTGPADGIYAVIVADASVYAAKTERPMLKLVLNVHNDPDHTSMQGKKLTDMNQALGHEGKDDNEKLLKMAGMLKRKVYQGFGVDWPKTAKAIDPRIFVGKTAFIELSHRDGTDDKGEAMSYPDVKWVSQDRSKLKGTNVAAGVIAAAGSNGTARSSARRR